MEAVHYIIGYEIMNDRHLLFRIRQLETRYNNLHTAYYKLRRQYQTQAVNKIRLYGRSRGGVLRKAR